MRSPILFFSLLFFVIIVSCSANKISDDERKQLFTIDNIIKNTSFTFKNIQKCENISKTEFLYYINQISYDFDSFKDSHNSKYLVITSTLQSFPSEFSAKNNILTQNLAFKIGFSLAGQKVGLKADNKLFTLGDDNYHSFITSKENKIGNYIITRAGRKVLQIIIIGIYFDDKNTLEDCVRETIINIKNANKK